MAGILIKGGTVVDGTGAKAFKADVRIEGNSIKEIAKDIAPKKGERQIDATGCYVTPGFIESHTHYDATMWWQPEMDPMPGYGITTIVMGNCGFSAAPISDDKAAQLEMIKIFSFFEDIPEEPFIKNLPWDWRKWSEYKKSLTEKVRLPTNYCAYMGHIALRLAVMGVDAWTRAATKAEIKEMAELLDDGMRAGALGLSTNWLDHDGQDRAIPTLLADDAEVSALLDVMERYDGASWQVIIDTFMRMTAPQSIERLMKLCKGRKIRVQVAGGVPTLEFQRPLVEQMKGLMDRAQAEGYDFWTGYAHVSPTNTLSLTRSLIFAQSNDYVWHEVVLAETEEEKLRLLKDPAWRARARESWDTKVWPHAPMANPHRLHLRNSDNGFGPVNLTLKAYADSLGLHPSDAMAEWIINNGVKSTVHMAPFDKNEDAIVGLLKAPLSVGNVNDAPAHGQMFCGSGDNVRIFTEYVRPGVISIEEAVHVLTGKLAEHFGLRGRGRLAVGERADVCVFNLDEVEAREEYKRFDVPAGNYGVTWRYTRDAAPMRATIVNGFPTFLDGHFTGAMPGEFIAPDAAPLALAAE